MAKINDNYSFEELKLVYESAEKVTDRRISLNKFNYSICTAVFLAIAFIWNWALTNPKYAYAGILIALVLSTIATIFTFYWIRQIKDYKLLNTAKFEVINEISKHVYFHVEGGNVKITPFEPFTKEWEILKKLSALQQNTKYNIKALKSSNLEYFIPSAFRIIFLILTFLSLTTVVLKAPDFFNALKGILLLQ